MLVYQCRFTTSAITKALTVTSTFASLVTNRCSQQHLQVTTSNIQSFSLTRVVRIMHQKYENSACVTCKFCAPFSWILCKFCAFFQADFFTLKLWEALLYDSVCHTSKFNSELAFVWQNNSAAATKQFSAILIQLWLMLFPMINCTDISSMWLWPDC